MNMYNSPESIARVGIALAPELYLPHFTPERIYFQEIIEKKHESNDTNVHAMKISF